MFDPIVQYLMADDPLVIQFRNSPDRTTVGVIDLRAPVQTGALWSHRVPRTPNSSSTEVAVHLPKVGA